MISKTVELFLEKYNLLKPKNNIIVAFSGGYDSICLLNIMKGIAQKYELNLFAIHLNHNWRGEESDKDELNCKEFCKDINFYSEKLAKNISKTETAAREARYDFFRKCAKKFNSNIILTAHNANDNAETVLYRLIKGTGIYGAEGIKEHRDIYYRPLLSIYRNEIEQYCKDNNLSPNVDSSNFNTKYIRNKIRYDIFPKLQEINPDVVKNINKFSQTAKAAGQILENNLTKLENLTTNEFCSMDNFYQSAIVHKFLRENNIDYDQKKIMEIVDFINKNQNSKSGKTHSLTTDLWIFTNNKKIEIVKQKPETEFGEINITKEGEYSFPNFKFIIKKINTKSEEFPSDKSFTAYISTDEINFTLRKRLPKDRIQPLGMQGSQSLKKYLNGKKIPKHEKENLIYLCKNNEVLWVPGIGISDKIKVKDVPTHIIKLEKRAK